MSKSSVNKIFDFKKYESHKSYLTKGVLKAVNVMRKLKIITCFPIV